MKERKGRKERKEQKVRERGIKVISKGRRKKGMGGKDDTYIYVCNERTFTFTHLDKS